ncbi:predicted protein [Chaetomium globosum CBS 148.51]|uniref:Uncharacterized protein n=1 Tax=Chaetomium globosum (strain ATCC 6205 / CBS 148.51 / DSM 1962 / NBRC 6347 / NRRL 1970) TaxID=306901 RepID=Q2H0B0_CHAGB|nr:uncharacterized protein CHGG_04786 [Chaetomium globosum CBS 148.51]EAQ88167.1 predicted protein [Chaetomium globosum CBS 148.51]
MWGGRQVTSDDSPADDQQRVWDGGGACQSSWQNLSQGGGVGEEGAGDQKPVRVHRQVNSSKPSSVQPSSSQPRFSFLPVTPDQGGSARVAYQADHSMTTSFARVLVSIINGRGLDLRNARMRPETAAIARRGAARWATCANPELRLASPGVVVCRLTSWRRESPQTRL